MTVFTVAVMGIGPIFISATIVAPLSVAIPARLFRLVVWPTERPGNFEPKRTTNSTVFGKAA